MGALECPASMGDSRRNLHARCAGISHQEFHQAAVGWRPIPRVIQSYLQGANDVPPIGLLLMDVPGLGGAGIHQRMAPLPEVIEEIIRLTDYLAKETALVRVRHELLDHDAFDCGRGLHVHASRFAPLLRTKSLTV